MMFVFSSHSSSSSSRPSSPSVSPHGSDLVFPGHRPMMHDSIRTIIPNVVVVGGRRGERHDGMIGKSLTEAMTDFPHQRDQGRTAMTLMMMLVMVIGNHDHLLCSVLVLISSSCETLSAISSRDGCSPSSESSG